MFIGHCAVPVEEAQGAVGYCMSPEAFAKVKAEPEMQSELTAVEASAWARAEQPGDLAKAAVMPPPLASELLALVDHMTAPKVRIRPQGAL